MSSKKHDSKSLNENNESKSIRQQVFKNLDKNPLLTAKPLCTILHLKYKDYGKYLADLKWQWKSHYHKEQGSKCSSVHGWRGWCFVVNGLDRVDAVGFGWILTKARNRWLLWKDKLGRLEWFETDRVNVYVRKPASLGKAYQLVCNAFSFTGLITDMKILEKVLASVRFKGAHFVFKTGQRLPKLTIELFTKTNGIVIKVGDRTHPSSVEVIATYMDWAERNEALLNQVVAILGGVNRNGSGIPNHIQDRDAIGVS